MLILMMGTGSAAGATFSGTYWNDVEMNVGFFFSDDAAELEFNGVTFGAAMSLWNVDVQTPTHLVFAGPTAPAFAGSVNISFEYYVPQVNFQWAEVLFDGVNYAIQRSGTLHFDFAQPAGSQLWGTNVFSSANAQFIDNYFNGPIAASVPVPNSVVLMLSAVAFMGFVRRGEDAGAALRQVTGG